MTRRLPILDQPGGSERVVIGSSEQRAERSVFVVSLGCPKNRVDTETMLGHLARDGYRSTGDPEAADLLLVNTCSFIESATAESVDTVLELSDLRARNPDKRLVVAGCMAQRYASQLRSEIPEVDVFVGTGEVGRIREAVRAAGQGSVDDALAYVGLPVWVQQPDEPRVNTLTAHSAYLKILEGCPQRCSFCIIPKLRGDLRSRRVGELVAEAQALADQGVKELVLIGQDNTSYGYDLGREVRLPGLLNALDGVEGIEWIRVMYLYPARVREAIIEAIAEIPKVLPYVDMPLQHASDRMLKAMNRATTRDKQRRLLDRMRERIPGLTLRSGFIVGFPGETDEDFQQLFDFVAEQRFHRLGVFTYSAEEGPPAAELSDAVPPELMEERRAALMTLQQRISAERNEGLVGAQVQVLIEGPHPETELLVAGRSPSQAPDIDGLTIINDVAPGVSPPRAGQVRTVEITEAHPYDVVGTVVA
jgi:ribosomal protein S12 methylthiotransferase